MKKTELHRHFLNAFLGLFICLTIVLVPLTTGNNLTKKYPEKYLKSKLVIAVWLIIGLHLFFFALLMYDRLIVK